MSDALQRATRIVTFEFVDEKKAEAFSDAVMDWLTEAVEQTDGSIGCRHWLYEDASPSMGPAEADGAQRLAEALEAWPCDWCLGTKVLTRDDSTNTCHKCRGSGLHPIASEALTTWRGEK